MNRCAFQETVEGSLTPVADGCEGEMQTESKKTINSNKSEQETKKIEKNERERQTGRSPTRPPAQIRGHSATLKHRAPIDSHKTPMGHTQPTQNNKSRSCACALVRAKIPFFSAFRFPAMARQHAA
jgi:hypothetical protein